MFGGNSEMVGKVCDGEEFGEQAQDKRMRMRGHLVVIGVVKEKLFVARPCN